MVFNHQVEAAAKSTLLSHWNTFTGKEIFSLSGNTFTGKEIFSMSGNTFTGKEIFSLSRKYFYRKKKIFSENDTNFNGI